MAELTKHKAADVLQEILDRWYAPKGWLFTEKCTALEMAIAVLRGWVKTADRLPTEADSWHGFVVTGSGKENVFGEEVSIEHIGTVPEDEHWPYWMPIPPLPEVDND